jgi:SAM-dependent methyltransferase
MPDVLMHLVVRQHPSFFQRHAIRVHANSQPDSQEKLKTALVFGQKFHTFPELYSHYEAQFIDCVSPLSKSFFRNKVILDAGCGTGRHLAFVAGYCPKSVFGVDVSNAVDVARQHTKHMPNVCIVQGDIHRLPFKEKVFDYAYSIGVLHHLSGPERGFDMVCAALKPGGAFSVWVYGRQSRLVRMFDAVRKRVLRRLPLVVNYGLSWILAVELYLLMKCLYSPLNRFRSTRRIAGLLPQNRYFSYLGQVNFSMVHEILFDQLIAPKADYYCREEFEKWFHKPVISSYKISERNGNSWRGLALIAKLSKSVLANIPPC